MMMMLLLLPDVSFRADTRLSSFRLPGSVPQLSTLKLRTNEKVQLGLRFRVVTCTG